MLTLVGLSRGDGGLGKLDALESVSLIVVHTHDRAHGRSSWGLEGGDMRAEVLSACLSERRKAAYLVYLWVCVCGL